jgi:hypothetical protein
MGNKGFETALAAVEMANLQSAIGPRKKPRAVAQTATRTGHPRVRVSKKNKIRSADRKSAG